MLHEEQGILVINLTELKEIVLQELSMKAIGALYTLIKVIDRFSKDKTTDIALYKAKTKNYHVRILKDTNWDDPLIVFRKRGFLKNWKCIDRKNVPEFAREIFKESCSEKQRQRLISKMMELKAFW